MWSTDKKIKMMNQLYTCGNNCKWENYITYELKPSRHYRDLKVPTRRVCPRCKMCGGKTTRVNFIPVHHADIHSVLFV